MSYRLAGPEPSDAGAASFRPLMRIPTQIDHSTYARRPLAVATVILCNTVAKRASQVIAVSVPPESAKDFERIARDEGRNKSELFREMLRVYRAHRETGVFESLQRYGASRARVVGVRDESDVERLIQEARGG